MRRRERAPRKKVWHANTQEIPQSEQPDTIEARLHHLSSLHDNGSITDAEYEAKRQAIIDEV